MLHEDDVLPPGTESPFLTALHAKNDTTDLFGYKLGESTANNRALLFFSGQTTQKFFIVNEIRRTAKKIRSCIVLKESIAKNFVANEHHSFTFVFTFSVVVVHYRPTAS